MVCFVVDASLFPEYTFMLQIALLSSSLIYPNMQAIHVDQRVTILAFKPSVLPYRYDGTHNVKNRFIYSAHE